MLIIVTVLLVVALKTRNVDKKTNRIQSITCYLLIKCTTLIVIFFE